MQLRAVFSVSTIIASMYFPSTFCDGHIVAFIGRLTHVDRQFVWEPRLQITENRQLKIKFECPSTRIEFFRLILIRIYYLCRKSSKKLIICAKRSKNTFSLPPDLPRLIANVFIWKVPQQNSFSRSGRAILPSLIGFFCDLKYVIFLWLLNSYVQNIFIFIFTWLKYIDYPVESPSLAIHSSSKHASLPHHPSQNEISQGGKYVIFV